MSEEKTVIKVAKKTGQILRIDEQEVRTHLDKMVLGAVEATLNQLLDDEADQLCKAKRYEHTDQREDTRAGHYKRQYLTKAGQPSNPLAKPFPSAIM